MTRIGWSVAAGLTGSVARLLFVSGIGCAIAGLYIALFRSLGERDPGHLWELGLQVMGFGAAGSLIGFIGVFALRPNRGRRRVVDPEWYGFPWLLLLGTAVALLCLSCGLRLVGDWQRSNVTVTATVSGCTANTGDTGGAYECTYDWDWNGTHHTQGRRPADAQYYDGHPVQLWIDPVTGGADDHGLTAMVYSFVGAGLIGMFDLTLCATYGIEVLESRGSFRRWLIHQAWWRRLPARPRPKPPAEPVIEDARPPYAAGVIEDARPPGY